MTSTYHTRQKALQHQVERLKRRIDTIQLLSRRYSWMRAAIVLLGGVATLIAAWTFSSQSGWLAFLCTWAVFAVAVSLHRRLDRWDEKYHIHLEMRSSQLARTRLAWDDIPKPHSLDRTRKPLEVDLDLTGERSLHHLIDFTISKQGSQLLAEWLTQETPDLDGLRERQGVVRELTHLPRFRDRFWLTFRLVSKEPLEAERLLRWLNETLPRSRLGQGLLISTLLALVNVTLFLLNTFGQLPPYWILSLIFYVYFYYINISAISGFLSALLDLSRELDKLRPILLFLETYPCAGSPNLSTLCRSFRDAENLPSRHLRKIGIAVSGIGLRANPILSMLLNLVLPWDIFFAYLADGYRRQTAQLLPAWLQTLHKLEGLISLANFAHLNPNYTFPEITPDARPIFHAQALGHPLIPPDQKVCNDFSIQEAGGMAIITGSNMAGKSTFVKTVGVNLCLAYAGGPVDAQSLRAIPLRLFTCIRISDSIPDGTSYFYAEVKRLKELLAELKAKSDWPLLYLIDEIFRGTNNRERLIGSRAYLRALIGQNSTGLLATHDLELASLAEQNPEVRNFHFRDHVSDVKLVFDYAIHPGPCPTTNALRIMEMEGLPVEVPSRPPLE